jgi:hypothetical protein
MFAEAARTGIAVSMALRSLRTRLPRRFRARVDRPFELRMGSPQYGRLVLDGAELVGSSSIEASSLLWSSDGRCLAAQELVSFGDYGLTTRVVVFDVERRSAIAVSPSRRGIASPVCFERGALIYRRWNQHTDDQELCLEIDSG